jgi:hypothetical protein
MQFSILQKTSGMLHSMTVLSVRLAVLLVVALLITTENHDLLLTRAQGIVASSLRDEGDLKQRAVENSQRITNLEQQNIHLMQELSGLRIDPRLTKLEVEVTEMSKDIDSVSNKLWAILLGVIMLIIETVVRLATKESDKRGRGHYTASSDESVE